MYHFKWSNTDRFGIEYQYLLPTWEEAVTTVGVIVCYHGDEWSFHSPCLSNDVINMCSVSLRLSRSWSSSSCTLHSEFLCYNLAVATRQISVLNYPAYLSHACMILRVPSVKVITPPLCHYPLYIFKFALILIMHVQYNTKIWQLCTYSYTLIDKLFGVIKLLAC